MNDTVDAACEAFEREMWPNGPAAGSGSGVWAKHKDRIVAAAKSWGCGCTIHDDRGETCDNPARICRACERECWGVEP